MAAKAPRINRPEDPARAPAPLERAWVEVGPAGLDEVVLEEGGRVLVDSSVVGGGVETMTVEDTLLLTVVTMVLVTGEG
jgi:hypothetical protein